MYNLHYSVKPCQNKPLQYKFDKRYQDAHLKAIEKENLKRITQENNRLLKRMHEIQKHSIIGNENDQYLEKSLNEEQRLKEVKRVTQENKEIIKRLKNPKNSYNRAKWENDWMNTLTYMTNISKFTLYHQKSVSKKKNQLTEDEKWREKK
ncbi:unnamed protein product [Schistosoma rodhaini]|uniref:Uncharacterized protein n=1 Tax=Schistosoma mansoni TaxID=6183 RepID=A0A5K4ECB7_SCHMA|nr:unnamed protein product [Schistosoma rodhaini]